MKRKVKFTWHEQHGEIFTNSKSQTCQSNPPQCILGSVTDFPFNQITLGGRFTLAPGEANRLSCFTNEAEHRNGNDQENTAVESKPGSPCHGGGPGRGNGASSTRPIFLQFLDSNIFFFNANQKIYFWCAPLRNSPSESARKQVFVTLVASQLTQISYFTLGWVSYAMRKLMSWYTEMLPNFVRVLRITNRELLGLIYLLLGWAYVVCAWAFPKVGFFLLFAICLV